MANVTHARWLWKTMRPFLPGARAAVAQGISYFDYVASVVRTRGASETSAYAQSAYIYATYEAVRADAAREGAKRPWSFDGIWNAPRTAAMRADITRLFGASIPGATREAVNAQVRTNLYRLYALFAVRTNTNATYEVTPNLGAAFSAIKLKPPGSASPSDSPLTDDLRLPFPALYVDVPVEAGLTIGVGATRSAGWTARPPAAVRGLYVVDSNLGAERALLLTAWPPTDPTRVGDPEVWDVFHSVLIPLPPGVEIEKAVAQAAARASDVMTRDDPSLRRTIWREWYRVMRWVTNFVFYVTVPETHDAAWELRTPEARGTWNRLQKETNKQTRAALREKYREYDPEEVVVVGRKFDKEHADKFERSGTGQKLQFRVSVAGHLRRQHYGPGRSLVKVIFVLDYVKGPKDAPMLARRPRKLEGT